MVSGFLGCSAPLDPEECPLLFMTSEAWLWSAPHCKHFFLSVAPDQHSCCKLPAFLGFPCPAQPAVDSSSISHLYVLICSLHLSSFSGQGLCSAPRANTSGRRSTDRLHLCSPTAPSFSDNMRYTTWTGNQAVQKFYPRSHLIYSQSTAERRALDQSLIAMLTVFCEAELSSTSKVQSCIPAQLWEKNVYRYQEHTIA